MMNLYVHIPFCQRKCLYCDFSSVAGSPVGADEYIGAVAEEMALRAAALPAPVTAATLYLGGGTPSLLEPEQVGRLIEAARCWYGLTADGEITLEANPGTVTRASLEGYRAAGVNRLSLGIQSFSDHFLSLLGRIHTARQALDAFSRARDAGFGNIGIDLIHSLPGQSLGEWLEDLAAGVKLEPEHVAAYGLTIEEGTPFHDMAAGGMLPLPDEEEALAMFRETSCILTHAGYEHYEISAFARPGRRSRHNQVYWRRTGYLGFGAGAHSFTASPSHGCRWKNEEDLPGYLHAIRHGVLPERERSCLTEREAMSEWMFLGLRMLEGVDDEAFRSTFGVPLDEVYPIELSRLVGNGLLVREGGKLRLSPEGLLLYNQVVLSFL